MGPSEGIAITAIVVPLMLTMLGGFGSMVWQLSAMRSEIGELRKDTDAAQDHTHDCDTDRAKIRTMLNDHDRRIIKLEG